MVIAPALLVEVEKSRRERDVSCHAFGIGFVACPLLAFIGSASAPYTAVALAAGRHVTYLAYARNDLAGATTLLKKATAEVGLWWLLLAAAADHLTLFFGRVPLRPAARDQRRVSDR